jgi:transcriptional regulator with XRE-family HTH domain
MTQEALAEVVGTGQPNISAYERGRRVPSADTMNKILVACGYELAATDGQRTIFCPSRSPGGFPTRSCRPQRPVTLATSPRPSRP